jgi:peptide/nickel transport system permease protein
VFAISITYGLLRLMPVDAVENIVAQISVQGLVYDPIALNALKSQLYEIFGLTGSPWEQYFRYLKSAFTLDFGPSILAFPTPVRDLIARFLPWTIGLLLMAVLISWTVGNILGMIASLRERGLSYLRFSRE